MRTLFSRGKRVSAIAAMASVAALGAATDAVLAAPPPHDAFAAAQVIAGERGTVTGTNAGATKEAGEPNHAGNQGGASVWYRWTAPRDGQFAFSTAGSDFDTVLAVYEGSDLMALTLVAADDDSGSDSGTSELSFRAAGGATYHIAVDGFQGKVGRIVLGWRPAPANDNFVDATTIAGARGAVSGMTRGATREAAEPPHGDERADHSVWFRWTAPADGRVGFFARGALGVYTGSSLETLTAKATRFDPPVTFVAAAGATYFVAVDHLAEEGSFVLTWGGAPPNDDFRNARTMSGLRGALVGTNVFASRERGEPRHAEGGSVWYRWRAPATRQTSLTTIGSDFDTVLAVYTGATLTSLRRVARNDDAGSGVSSVLRFRAIRGRVYRIVVAGFGNNDMGRIRLSWRTARAAAAEPPRLTASVQ